MEVRRGRTEVCGGEEVEERGIWRGGGRGDIRRRY